MNIVKISEKILTTNRRLVAANIPVIAGLSYGDSIGIYLTLSHTQKSRDNRNYPKINDTVEELILQAKELDKTIYTLVKHSCADIFNVDLYIDKEESVTAKSVTSEDVSLSNGQTVSYDRLYIKN